MTTLADIDRSLAALRTGTDELGERLLELELDGDRGLLDAAQLTGATATRWSAAAANLLTGWQSHAQLTAILERADGLRGSRRRVRPDRLVELGELLDGPGELLVATAAAVDEAAAVVREAGAAWEAFTPQLAAAGAALAGAALDVPLVEHERLTAALAADPLSIDPGQIDALDRAIETAEGELAEIAGLREEGRARLAAARALLDQVEEAQRVGETAHQAALAKIANASVPAPRRALSQLDAGLRGVDALIQQEAWLQARDALARWTGDAKAELGEALAIVAANRAPVERRNQLRGLLSAYQAKARGIHALEDPEVADLFDRAEGALYRVPVDLDAAAELVGRYQRALARHASHSEVLP
jgi:hypothetical protein